MRYCFLPEIEMLTSQHDFEAIEVGGLLTGRTLDEHWSAYAAGAGSAYNEFRLI
jgi:hypothetical protein